MENCRNRRRYQDQRPEPDGCERNQAPPPRLRLPVARWVRSSSVAQADHEATNLKVLSVDYAQGWAIGKPGDLETVIGAYFGDGDVPLSA